MSDAQNILGLFGGLKPPQQNPFIPPLSPLAEALKTPQPSSSSPTQTQPNVALSKRRILFALSQAVDGDISNGRVLPSSDDIVLADGRKLKAAILYNDIKGFTQLVAGAPKRKTLAILHAFVSEMTRVAIQFDGEVVDCAGDRIMAVFWRPHNSNDLQPIYDAICCGFWMQTVMQRAFQEVLRTRGLPVVSCGIGIDYGEVIVTRVGIRNRNKLVLLGNVANYAAKLEDGAVSGQTIISPVVYNNRPSFMAVNNGWSFQAYPDAYSPTCYLSNNVYAQDVAQRFYGGK